MSIAAIRRATERWADRDDKIQGMIVADAQTREGRAYEAALMKERDRLAENRAIRQERRAATEWDRQQTERLTHLETELGMRNKATVAGLEATQTGDLDKSVGKNNFVLMSNPGLSDYVLEQSGVPNALEVLEKEYVMKVTGIKPSGSYVFSCWVAWDDNFNGDHGIVSFSDVSSIDPTLGFKPVENTDLGGSYLNDEDDRILKTVEINGLTW